MFIFVEMSYISFLLKKDNQKKLDQRLSDVLFINENDFADKFDRFWNTSRLPITSLFSRKKFYDSLKTSKCYLDI